MSLNQPSSQGRKRYPMSTSNKTPTTNTTIPKSTGPYDRNFQQNLIDGGVYPDEYEYPGGQVPPQPNNWEEINQRLAQSRASLSPSQFSEADFRKFKRLNAHAFKEKQITTSVIPIIEGEVGDAKCVSGGIPFTNLDHLTDGTLVPGNPDLYYGARPEQLDRKVRSELSDRIIPSTQDDLPIAPNFFLAAKGPDGSLAVAERQASYDGALGTRGMQSLQLYGQDGSFHDNNAYTITSTYHGGQLILYTSHLSQPTNSGGRPEYYMTQINAWGMKGNLETFRQGASAFRNARDWAKEQREEAIKNANQRVHDNQVGTPTVDANFGPVPGFTSEASQDELSTIDSLSPEFQPSSNQGLNATVILQDSETSTDELILDYIPPAKRSKTQPKKIATTKESQRRELSDGSHGH